jgi:hypothetical protein
MPRNGEIAKTNMKEHERERDRIDKEIKRKQAEKIMEDGPQRTLELEQEIRELARDLGKHNHFVLEFMFYGSNDGNDSAAEQKIQDNIQNGERVKELVKEKSDDPPEVKQVKGDIVKIEDRTNKIIEEFWKTYKKDSQINMVFAIVGVGFAIASLGLSIACLYYGVNPKEPSGGGSSQPSGGGSNAGPPTPNFLASNALVGDDGTMTDDEIEDMMQHLVATKAVIAEGAVSQEKLWPNLGAQADQMSIEDQNLTLIFVQEAAVDLPGTREFFWLDPSEAKERYEALRAAHKRSGKFSDVYLEATKIRYDDSEVPMFHVASLTQYALRLIRHDLLYPDDPPH